MARLLLYYAHPGHKFSRSNRELAEVAKAHSGVSFVDLYFEYPRYEIDVDKEQDRLRQHDVIVFQHPLFWYSVPALLKEWIDLVLEHGFAFGDGGDELKGKVFMNSTTAGGPEDAYTPEGYQHFSLRTFLTPLEQTARLCHMHYSAPYVLYSAIKAREDVEIASHAEGFRKLLDSIVSDRFDFDQAVEADVITAASLDTFLKEAR